MAEGRFLADRAAVRDHLVARGEPVEDRGSGFGVGTNPAPGPASLVTLAWIRPGMVHAYAVHPDPIPSGRRDVVARQVAALNALLPLPGLGLTQSGVVYAIYAPMEADGSVSSGVVDRLLDLVRRTTSEIALELKLVLTPPPPPT